MLSSGHMQKQALAQYCKRGDFSGIILQCKVQLLHVKFFNLTSSPILSASLSVDDFIISSVLKHVNTLQNATLIERKSENMFIAIILNPGFFRGIISVSIQVSDGVITKLAKYKKSPPGIL